MDKIQIHTSSREYPVFVGRNAIGQIPIFLKEKYPSLTKVLIITDENVANLYLDKLKQILADFSHEHLIVPNGEKAKTFDVYYDCLSFALEQKLDRHSLIIAFGGGAVGDLSGFVAATFMRGIPFIQVPTTILAHDSAVGGKVAINHPLGKNMVGAFHQPDGVFYDLAFLESLPPSERRSGFAEVIKHGLIQDEQFFMWLKENISTLDSFEEEDLKYFLRKGIEIKGRIVSEDEREKGIRSFLNFGHTLGHAIEAVAGYGKITHGEAVAVGMIFALRLSKNVLDLVFPMEPFIAWLQNLGYETNLPAGLDEESLLSRMKQDKKAVKGEIQFVLLESVGKPVLRKLEDDFILEQIKEFKRGGN